MEFQRLFSPIRLGPREVKNRLVFQAHQTCFAFCDDQDSGDRYIAYQEARARGGAGMIVLEAEALHPTSEQWRWGPPSPEIMTEKFRRMAEALHKHGVTVLNQIVHLGREAITQSPVPPWGFSAIPSLTSREVPHEMSKAEIHEVVDAFAARARMLRAAGLDGVELGATHGYLLLQSYSPFANQRQDEYGGDFDRRLRFAKEVIEACRDALGADLIMGIRVSGDDWMEGGLGTDGIIEVCRALVATGKLDYINVSAGSRCYHYTVTDGSTYIPPGVLVPYAAAFKEAFPDIPIGTTCRIKDPAEAEAILNRGQADFVGMTRMLIADPEMPTKARSGNIESVRECISCSQGCVDRMRIGNPIMCTQNPEVGNEHLGGLKPAPVKKRVLVVGGGPAGLEAARVAATRGHEVTLCEASDDIGGQVRLSVKTPTRSEFDPIVRYRRHELKRLGVTVKLNTKVDAELARSLRPDAIILATGATPFRPQIPGADRPNVLNSWEVLSGERPVGERVAMIDLRGEHESASVADFLLEQGKQLQIITPFAAVVQPLIWPYQEFMQRRLLERGAKFVTRASVVAIGESSLDLCRSDWPAEKWTIEGIDTVVLMAGNRANDDLKQSLEGIAPEIYLCGDCAAPRWALQAVPDGYRVGALV